MSFRNQHNFSIWTTFLSRICKHCLFLSLFIFKLWTKLNLFDGNMLYENRWATKNICFYITFPANYCVPWSKLTGFCWFRGEVTGSWFIYCQVTMEKSQFVAFEHGKGFHKIILSRVCENYHSLLGNSMFWCFDTSWSESLTFTYFKCSTIFIIYLDYTKI